MLLKSKHTSTLADTRLTESHAYRWTENISQRMKAIGKKRKENPHQRKEISRSVFEPAELYPGHVPQEKTLDHNPPMSDDEYKA